MDIATKLGVYGAILATALFLKDIIMWAVEQYQNRRKVLVKIQYVPYYEYLKLIISNESKIPTKIVDLIIIQYIKYNNKYQQIDEIPRNCYLSTRQEKLLDDIFPVLLSQGESIEIILNDHLIDFYFNNDKFFIVEVFDTSGRKYKITRTETFNPKFGGISKVKNKFKKSIFITIRENFSRLRYKIYSYFEEIRVKSEHKKNNHKDLG
jgi:hypothetical protein